MKVGDKHLRLVFTSYSIHYPNDEEGRTDDEIEDCELGADLYGKEHDCLV